MPNPDVHWISTYGGRFIAMPDALLAEWHGCPDDGRDPLDTSHDYGRACSTTGYVAHLPIGQSTAIVFGENKSGGVLLGCGTPIVFEWIYADSPDAVVAALQRLPDDIAVDAELPFHVDSDHLNVFDSAFAGCDFEPQHSCRFLIKSGRYVIGSSLYEPNTEIGLVVHRFTPV
ncbi:hypothetical protein FHS27_006375 [Rhodopirellula rubra]|uniref:Uncharacterized protein n=1 Tax=Aporhodopirellula rubra TaxID=980271 RepID=A0A7W5E5J3_9BACT|nr:Imm21 family immunity protein [Aporhodopirellula rubra]MBB3210528.1 hypothetical protein [Aporhodopirellula rubra]